MSDTPATVINRGRWTPVLDEALTRCRHQQRAMYNRTINAVSPQGGAVPATMKSPGHPNGLYGQLTEWRGKVSWIADIAVALARPAEAREALKAHEGAVRARCARLLDESDAWTRWMVEHPDCGAWDALSTEEKRERAGDAPPRSASTWRDERGGDGSRTELYRRRKRDAGGELDTPPRRVDAQTLRSGRRTGCQRRRGCAPRGCAYARDAGGDAEGTSRCASTWREEPPARSPRRRRRHGMRRHPHAARRLDADAARARGSA